MHRRQLKPTSGPIRPESEDDAMEGRRETRGMKRKNLMSKILLAGAGAVVVMGTGTSVATATEPCGDFEECKTLIEINASDGDIGFHFLMDGEGLNSAKLEDPNGKQIFKDKAKRALKDQKLTETFVESAEPLCWADPEADPDDEIVTLEEFLDRWSVGTYVFAGKGDKGAKSTGETELTYELPAAPADLSRAEVSLPWKNALIAMTGMSAVAGLLFSSPRIASPLRPGSSRSSTMAPGEDSRTARRASLPL